MINKQTPISWVPLMILPILIFNSLCHAASSLGEINIELRGNVVGFTCTVITSDSNKSVKLGTWPTKQLQTGGDITQPVASMLKLEGCPPGSASITFSGTPTPDMTLSALGDAAMAQKVAIELYDNGRMRLSFEQVSQTVGIDKNDNAALAFFADCTALVDGVQPGLARAGTTFIINYN